MQGQHPGSMPANLPAETLYVSMAATRTYQEHKRCGEEQARRELTELLCGAGRRGEEEPGRPAQYRHRTRATRLDITARVVREGKLLVVVAVNIRGHSGYE